MNESIVNILLNWLTVSVPEETIWTIAVLVTLKRFDLLDKYRWRQNIVWLSIPVLSSTVLIAVLRYIIDAPRIFITLSAIISIYLSIVYIFRRPENNILNEKIQYFKILFYVLLNFAIMIVFVESLYYPVLLSYLKISIEQINNNWFMNLLLSIPGRIIEFLIVILILSIQNRKAYLSIMKSIFLERKISIVIAVFVSILIVFWIMLIDIFGNYKMLSMFKTSQQIMLNMLLLIVPSLLLVLMTYLIILFVEKINTIQKSHQNMFNDIFDDDINM